MEKHFPTRFRSHLDYLNAVGNQMTYQRFAKELGYRSPRSIAMVLKGQRLPSAEMVHRIARHQSLSEDEHHYLELLVQTARAKNNGRPSKKLEHTLTELAAELKTPEIIAPEVFALISKWYHYVLKQMIEAPGFVEDMRKLRHHLRNKVTEGALRSAIQTLLNSGLIQRDPKGALRTKRRRIMTTTDVPVPIQRMHQAQMLDRAKEALNEQPCEEREITTMTMQIRKRDIKAAKEMIREFRDRFTKKFHKSSRHIYQLNIQLFEHTQYDRRT